MKCHWHGGLGAALAAAWLATGIAAAQNPVDLELVLAVDVSGSMDPDEHRLQRAGYVEALAHPDVTSAIRSGIYGRIAVTYVEWAGPVSQVIILPWTLVDSESQSRDFSAALAAAPFSRIRGTSISGGLAFASRLFDANDFDGIRRVIDVSGDGPNSRGAPVEPIRDAVVDQGIIINGLPIMLKTSLRDITWNLQLYRYYQDCVIGGPGAFVIAVREREQIATAIRRKLVLEIAGRPAEILPASQLTTPRKADCLIGEKMRGTQFLAP